MSAASERTALYWIRGEGDELLYVGMTGSLRERWNGHAARQPWWDELRSLTVDWYGSRDEAEAAERSAIEAEAPKYNKKYLGPRRERRQSPPRHRICMHMDDLLALPVEVGVEAAGRALGVGRGAAYLRAKDGTFPFPVRRVNGRYSVRKADLMQWFGLDIDGKPLPVPAAGSPEAA